MKLIDTHGHLNSKEFNDNIDLFIKKATKEGVSKIIVPGTNYKDSLIAIKMAKKYKNVFALVALHPNNAFKIEDAKWIENINVKDIIGVGETGIDLYWKNNPPLEIQKIIFEKHLQLAKNHNLPISIHMRNSEEEIFKILNQKQFKNVVTIIHSYTSNLEWAQKFIKLGCYISFSGIVTFKNAKNIQEVAQNIDLEKILIETDSPYLAPTPLRGKINEPSFLKHTANFIANLRKEENEIVIKQIYKNTNKVFDFKENI